MNLHELESTLTEHEISYDYVWKYGPDKGKTETMTDVFDWSYWMHETPAEGVDIPGVGHVSREAQHGGEGEGDQAWVVLRIEHEDGQTKYYRKDGYYASFDGMYFDADFTEVTPTPKTITVYKAVK